MTSPNTIATRPTGRFAHKAPKESVPARPVPFAIYCDGGLLSPNPSSVGGTWAFVYVDEANEEIYAESGLVTLPQVAPSPTVSNNHSELAALLHSLRGLPRGWSGTIYSDSHVTIERFRNFKIGGAASREKLEKTVPAVWVNNLERKKKELGDLGFVLLAGHPTKANLEAGTKGDLPVSIHNKRCDDLCNEAKARFWADSRGAWFCPSCSYEGLAGCAASCPACGHKRLISSKEKALRPCVAAKLESSAPARQAKPDQAQAEALANAEDW